MKKKQFGSIVGIVIMALAMMFAGCILDQPPDTKTPVSNGTNLERHEQLALIKALDNHKVSMDELQSIVVKVMAAPEGRSIAAKGSSITGVQKLPLAGENRFSSFRSGRSVEDTEEEPVEVYAFAVGKPGGTQEGFVLASNDVRIGNILAIAEGSLADANEDFIEVLQANLEDYIAATIYEYDRITDAEIDAAVKKTFTDEEGARAFGNHFSGLKQSGSAYDYSSDFIARKQPLLKTKWGQGSTGAYSDGGYAYNNYVKLWFGTSEYVTGCVPTAMAQIIAYHNYIKSVESYMLNEFYHPYVGEWTGTYNLSQIRTMEKIYNSSQPREKAQVAVLMYQIGMLGSAVYKANGSTTMTDSQAYSVFQTLGYSIANSGSATSLTETSTGFTVTYLTSLDTIKNALNSNKPIYISGASGPGTIGHAWVIDGYGDMTQYVEYFYNSSTGQYTYVSFSLSGCLMVHCNLGWNGNANGWYVYGIFDTNNRTLIESSNGGGGNYSTNTFVIIPQRP